MEEDVLSVLLVNINYESLRKTTQSIKSSIIEGLTRFRSNHIENYDEGYNYVTSGLQNLKDSDIQKAVDCFNKINQDDALVIQCRSWMYLAECYAILHKWKLSYIVLSKIKNAQIRAGTLQKDDIRKLQKDVSHKEADIKQREILWERIQLIKEIDLFIACDSIKACNAYFEAYPNGKFLDKVEIIRKRLAHKVPNWVYITIGVILEIVTVLICYFIFRC